MSESQVAKARSTEMEDLKCGGADQREAKTSIAGSSNLEC